MWATCTDTPNWNNSLYQFDCDYYESAGNCANGDFVSGKEWTGGKNYNYPEDNCCVCGKSSKKLCTLFTLLGLLWRYENLILLLWKI